MGHDSHAIPAECRSLCLSYNPRPERRQVRGDLLHLTKDQLVRMNILPRSHNTGLPMLIPSLFHGDTACRNVLCAGTGHAKRLDTPQAQEGARVHQAEHQETREIWRSAYRPQGSGGRFGRRSAWIRRASGRGSWRRGQPRHRVQPRRPGVAPKDPQHPQNGTACWNACRRAVCDRAAGRCRIFDTSGNSAAPPTAEPAGWAGRAAWPPKISCAVAIPARKDSPRWTSASASRTRRTGGLPVSLLPCVR